MARLILRKVWDGSKRGADEHATRPWASRPRHDLKKGQVNCKAAARAV